MKFWHRLVLVILVAALIPAVFEHSDYPFTTPEHYLSSVIESAIYTLLIWEGCYLMVVKLRERYPTMSQSGKRILIQFVLVTIYTSIISVSGCILINPLLGEPVDYGSILFHWKISIGISYFILSIYEGVYFFSRWKKSLIETEELKRQHLISQFESLKNQLSPHFLFNSLNTLMTLIGESPDKATDFTQKLANIYRYVLQQKDEELVSISVELDFIQSYFFLLKCRFGENISLDVHIPAHAYEMQIPPLSLQILLENAVKHNVISREKPLSIQLGLSEANEITVRNNYQPKEQVSPGTRLGLQNIINRYKLLGNLNVAIERGPRFFTVRLPAIQLKYV